jgi:hypothetical protein
MKKVISIPSPPWQNLSWHEIAPLALAANLATASLAWLTVALVMA